VREGGVKEGGVREGGVREGVKKGKRRKLGCNKLIEIFKSPWERKGERGRDLCLSSIVNV
jgi:hypothetical protein